MAFPYPVLPLSTHPPTPPPPSRTAATGRPSPAATTASSSPTTTSSPSPAPTPTTSPTPKQEASLGEEAWADPTLADEEEGVNTTTKGNNTKESTKNILLHLINKLEQSIEEPRLQSTYFLLGTEAISPIRTARDFGNALTNCLYEGSNIFGPKDEKDLTFLQKQDIKKIWIEVSQPAHTEEIFKYTNGIYFRPIFHFAITERPKRLINCAAFEIPQENTVPARLLDLDCSTKLPFFCSKSANNFTSQLKMYNEKVERLKALKLIIETVLPPEELMCSDFDLEPFLNDNEASFEFGYTLLSKSLQFLKKCTSNRIIPPFKLPELWHISLIDIILTICTLLSLGLTTYVVFLKQPSPQMATIRQVNEFTPSAPTMEKKALLELPHTDPPARKKVQFLRKAPSPDWDLDSEPPPEDRV